MFATSQLGNILVRTPHSLRNEKGLAASAMLVFSTPAFGSRCQLVYGSATTWRFANQAWVVSGFQRDVADDHSYSLRLISLCNGIRFIAAGQHFSGLSADDGQCFLVSFLSVNDAL